MRARISVRYFYSSVQFSLYTLHVAVILLSMHHRALPRCYRTNLRGLNQTPPPSSPTSTAATTSFSSSSLFFYFLVVLQLKHLASCTPRHDSVPSGIAGSWLDNIHFAASQSFFLPFTQTTLQPPRPPIPLLLYLRRQFAIFSPR